jgi:hypothetical protein
MVFEEQLQQVIESAGAERAKEERAKETFDSDWKAARGAIYALFERAAIVFKANAWIGNAEAKIKNGSVYLYSGMSETGNYLHQLEFTAHAAALEIRCTVTTGEPAQSYSIDQFDQKIIEERVKAFAHGVARHPRPFSASR